MLIIGLTICTLILKLNDGDDLRNEFNLHLIVMKFIFDLVYGCTRRDSADVLKTKADLFRLRFQKQVDALALA